MNRIEGKISSRMPKRCCDGGDRGLVGRYGEWFGRAKYGEDGFVGGWDDADEFYVGRWMDDASINSLELGNLDESVQGCTGWIWA